MQKKIKDEKILDESSKNYGNSVEDDNSPLLPPPNKVCEIESHDRDHFKSVFLFM